MARHFSRELRAAAAQAQAVSEDAVGDLRTILDDALDRIKAEVFGTADAPGPDDTPGLGTLAAIMGTARTGTARTGTARTGTPTTGTRAKTGSRMGRGGVKIGSCLVP